MKRAVFLRRLADAWDACDGDGEKLVNALLTFDCIGTCRGVSGELRLAADDVDRADRAEEQRAGLKAWVIANCRPRMCGCYEDHDAPCVCGARAALSEEPPKEPTP